ncbi:hypothetical protein Pcinc_040861 [Petrolisthes cinctipes]|uniref:Uncharacterized protein n=1 Tax=Petrolisthes cinctipes TaxID=88211 RepID=A0AAE1BKP5_PETCI|nr:hypothetical protein Pcinc_040861 [Petrolisthes cinctipes]
MCPHIPCTGIHTRNCKDLRLLTLFPDLHLLLAISFVMYEDISTTPVNKASNKPPTLYSTSSWTATAVHISS